jgi:hypothetical protein
MRARTHQIYVVAAVALACAGNLLADPTTESARTVGPAAVETVFSETERRVIERYFGKSERWTAADHASDAGSDRTIGTARVAGQGKAHGGRAKGAKGKGKGGKSKGLPPGLARRETLPPGLARKLERDGSLPPGLAKRSLPEDLEARLPARLDGTERVIVDRDVLLVELATGIVRDVIRDVLD